MMAVSRGEWERCFGTACSARADTARVKKSRENSKAMGLRRLFASRSNGRSFSLAS